MTAIAAATFAAAAAIDFQSRGEFGLGAPGAMLDVWLGQQSREVVLSMVVDPSTATEENGLHEVLADIIGTSGGRSWGVRVALSGYASPVEGSDAPHWTVDASEIHAPAVSLSDDAADPLPADAVTAPSAVEAAHRHEHRLSMADAGGSAHDPELFARTLEGLDAFGIHAHTADALDELLDLRRDKRSVRLAPVRGTHRVDGSTVTIEASIEVVETDGREVSQPVLVTIADVRDPFSSPVIEPR